MVDMFAALFRFRQFIFEFGPFLLAAWTGLALSTGILTLVLKRQTKVQASANSLRRGKFWHWIWQFILLMLWRPGGQMPAHRAFSVALLFGLAAAIPSLVVTSLIDVKAVLLRLALTVLFSLSLGWLLNLTVLPKPTEPQGRLPEAGLVSIVNDNTSFSQSVSPFSIIQVAGGASPGR